MVDPEGVSTRLDQLAQLLEELERIRAAGHDAYRDDLRSRLAADHAVQLSVQVCIDIGAHLVAELGLEPPADYRGIFDSLRSAGLEPDLADHLEDAVGMRNVLVHGYLEVDDQVIWGALDRLDDLRRFAAFAQGKID